MMMSPGAANSSPCKNTTGLLDHPSRPVACLSIRSILPAVAAAGSQTRLHLALQVQTQTRTFKLLGATASRFRGTAASRFRSAAAAAAVAAVLVAQLDRLQFAVEVGKEVADRGRTAAGRAAARITGRSASARRFGGARRGSGTAASRFSSRTRRFSSAAGGFTAGRSGTAAAAEHAVQKAKRVGFRRRNKQSGNGHKGKDHSRFHGEGLLFL